MIERTDTEVTEMKVGKGSIPIESLKGEKYKTNIIFDVRIEVEKTDFGEFFVATCYMPRCRGMARTKAKAVKLMLVELEKHFDGTAHVNF